MDENRKPARQIGVGESYRECLFGLATQFYPDSSETDLFANPTVEQEFHSLN